MKYYLWILGCAMNYSDAERLASVLESLGYKKTEKEADADLVITIACSVRQTAIDRIYGKAKLWSRYKKKNKNLKLGLSGCVLPQDKKKMGEIFDFTFDIKNLQELPELLNNNSTFKFQISNCENDYLGIKPEYESHFRAYVPIMTGCDNFCTYCAVPYTRGREVSRSVKEVVAEIKGLIEGGYKEITLLGQNVNSYAGKKNGIAIDFSTLLKEIDQIKGDYRVYFYSNHPKDMSDELIKVLPGLKHYPKYIHLPLQSGNDEIIRKMNRHYTKGSYLKLVEKIRKAMPEVTLTTDIIVGFPGESEAAFLDTKEVMEKVGFDMAFLARYSPRTGTVAAKMADNVTKVEKKQREDVLQKVLRETALANNKKLIGTKQRVLVDGIKKNIYYGRTEGYKVVEIKTDQPLEVGQFVEVEIESVSAWKIFGKLV